MCSHCRHFFSQQINYLKSSLSYSTLRLLSMSWCVCYLNFVWMIEAKTKSRWYLFIFETLEKQTKQGGGPNQVYSKKRKDNVKSLVLRYVKTSQIKVGIWLSVSFLWRCCEKSYNQQFKKLLIKLNFFLDPTSFVRDYNSKPLVNLHVCEGINMNVSKISMLHDIKIYISKKNWTFLLAG